MINIYDTLLYLLNSILVIFGILFMVYSIKYFSVEDYYCDNLYFLAIMIMINSLMCLVSIQNYKLIGFIMTALLFSYNIYNIIAIPCALKNYIFNSYISVIVVNGITILVYIFYFCNKRIVNEDEINLV
jgi:hypothetical protein